jgi:tRNA pseudouridine55 synthase
VKSPHKTASLVSGYLLLDKKPGLSSFASLSIIKKALGTGKVGHAGTLDSFARGLLLVLAGRATKLAPWFSAAQKKYLGTILFGEETDTLDGEGRVIARAEAPSRQALENALSGFRGEILQSPPAYSALHVGGERAYALARRGLEPVMEKRPVTIYELELLRYESPLADIAVRCSKGTYIRSLARDLAIAAGSRGRLFALTRSAIGGFTLDNALSLDGDGDSREKITAALSPVTARCFEALGMPLYYLGEKAARDMRCGRALSVKDLERKGQTPEPALHEEAAVCAEDGAFLGIVQRNGSRIQYRYVYAGGTPENAAGASYAGV